MKNKISLILILILTLVLVSCNKNKNKNNDKIKVISTFTIITNIVEEIGKEKVEVHNLVKTGTDPHDYEPLPLDIKKATDANLFFYNGFNLEGGSNGWFFKMLKSVGKDTNIYNLSENIEPLHLNEANITDETINPHYFISPKNGLIMAENVLKALISYDDENKEYYEENYIEFKNKLESIEENYNKQFQEIDEEKRIIVTSERAFQYLAKDYNIIEAYIWAIDTEENGSSEQIKQLINFLKSKEINYLFLESNVDPRPMETVSKESGIKIYKNKVYSDEIGKKGEKVDTYLKYLEYNLDVFIRGLKGE